MAFQVFVQDNFHACDDSDFDEAGVYTSLDEAIAVCRAIVDRDLAHQYRPGMTTDELYNRYTSFGADPFIRNTEQPRTPSSVMFSASTYARQRSDEICRQKEREARPLSELERTLARFPETKQAQIRAEIAKRVKNGYPLKYLVVTARGLVQYDRYAAEHDITGL
jgi:hypothetical protein